ncbi:MAG: hypothetical protein ACREVH_04410 [Gammaproteobacteria bacterium]
MRVRNLVGFVGPLRTLLIATVAILVAAAPCAEGATGHSGWDVVRGAVAPALATLAALALPVDMAMAGIFMTQASERSRYRTILRLDLLLLILLLIAWIPVIRSGIA